MPTFLLSGLANAAFPDSEPDGDPAHADVLVHVPAGFRPTGFGLAVYLHGFENCVENAAAAPPGVHDPPHPSADLIGQLERSGKSAILLLPETRYHARSGDPGRLGEREGFLRLVGEVFERLRGEAPELLAGLPGNASALPAIRHTVLISHSGGYKAAAAIAETGGLPIEEVVLLDSLYGEDERFAAIADAQVRDLAGGRGGRRLINLYREGSTAKRARPQAAYLRELLARHALPEELLLFDDSEAPLDEDALRRPLVVKRVTTEHSDLGRTYVEALLRTSGLPSVD